MRLFAPLTALVLTVTLSPTALAAGGQSTPGAVVAATAVQRGSLQLTVTAHSEWSTVADPSCRPKDATIDCWGSLVFRGPDGLTARGIEVHRVAVGDTSCSGGEEGGDECGGDMAMAALAWEDSEADTVYAAVRGLSVLVDPGSTQMVKGSTVQVFVDLARSPDGDQVRVRVRPFVEGPSKPAWAYDSDWQPALQVQIHLLGSSG